MSTVPAAKVALKALMEAWPWPVSSAGDTPVIHWGAPVNLADQPVAGEVIFFGETQITDESPTLGDTRFDETYALRIVIDVTEYGDDEQATEQRAWDLYASLVSLLNANRTLGDTINRYVGRTVRQVNGPASPEQWRSQIVVDQECVGFVFNP